MAIKYIATFADGSTHERTSASERVYSHCWRVKYLSQSGTRYHSTGFSGSYALAASEVRKYERYADTTSEPFETEIVAVAGIHTKKRGEG